MDDIKRCSKFGIISLKPNFHKNKNLSDGLHPRCRTCWKRYSLDNRDRKKYYYLNNRDRLKEYCLQNRDR